jgi:hypothetical protein
VTRLALATALVVALVAVAGCGGDDVRTALSNARTSVTVPTLPAAPTVTTTTPARTATVTRTATVEAEPEPAPVQTATATRTTTTVTTSGKAEEDSILPIVLVLVAAALIVLGFIALWRRARSEPSAWEQRLTSAQGVARWAATDLPPALLDPGRPVAERERSWHAQRPELHRTARDLTVLADEARRGGDRDAVGAMAVALTELTDALDAHVRSGTSDAAALVQLRARDLLGALERETR